jgi:hypothetical protein
MALTIWREEGNRVIGRFEFKTSRGTGIYAVEGTAQSDGKFSLKAGRWIHHPGGTVKYGFEGRVTVGTREIEATFPQCRTGRIHASRTGDAGPRPNNQRSAARPTQRDGTRTRNADAWVESMRDKIAAFERQGDATSRAWRQIRHEIIFRKPIGVPAATEKQLFAALDAARAKLGADALLARLASDTTTSRNGKLGGALQIAYEARRMNWWPEKELSRVIIAARNQAAEVLRLEFQAVAALADKLPETLDGLVQARAALAPLDRNRASLLQAFRTDDPEDILEPLLRRIAAIERPLRRWLRRFVPR